MNGMGTLGAAVTDAARMMEKERIHRVLVLDQDVPVGILTSWDILRGVAHGDLVPAAPEPSLAPPAIA